MFKIIGTTIKLTRGDAMRLKVEMVNQDETTYTPVEGDVVSFAVKRRYEDASPIIEKTIPNATQVLYLEPADTSSLPFGSYVYDLEIKFANGDVDTFIDKAILEICEKVDRSDDEE